MIGILGGLCIRRTFSEFQLNSSIDLYSKQQMFLVSATCILAAASENCAHQLAQSPWCKPTDSLLYLPKRILAAALLFLSSYICIIYLKNEKLPLTCMPTIWCLVRSLQFSLSRCRKRCLTNNVCCVYKHRDCLCAIANSFVLFLTVPLALLVVPEYSLWANVLWQCSSAESVIIRRNIVVVLFCVLLAVSKQVDRMSKFGIVHASSTIFFAGIDSVMKMVAGLGSLIFFDNGGRVVWPEDVSFLMVCASVWLLYIDKSAKVDAAKKEIYGSDYGVGDGGLKLNVIH